jgi:hypothetical protein
VRTIDVLDRVVANVHRLRRRDTHAIARDLEDALVRLGHAEVLADVQRARTEGILQAESHELFGLLDGEAVGEDTAQEVGLAQPSNAAQRIGKRLQVRLGVVVGAHARRDDQRTMYAGPKMLPEPDHQLVEVVAVVAGELLDDIVQLTHRDLFVHIEAGGDDRLDCASARLVRELGRREKRVVDVEEDGFEGSGHRVAQAVAKGTKKGSGRNRSP